nr:MAG TPA: hypothetical protein [Bacteriophage sp.]
MYNLNKLSKLGLPSFIAEPLLTISTAALKKLRSSLDFGISF